VVLVVEVDGGAVLGADRDVWHLLLLVRGRTLVLSLWTTVENERSRRIGLSAPTVVTLATVDPTNR
jgi:hypothetical protein